jgi:hypothetical protein
VCALLAAPTFLLLPAQTMEAEGGVPHSSRKMPGATAARGGLNHKDIDIR